MTDSSCRCDVAVVGAGPAGSAAAYFLAQTGLDVLLIDRAKFPRDKTCGDALSPRALQVVDTMGALAEARAQGQIIRSLRFFSPGGWPLEAAIPHYPGHSPFALILPRLILDDLLLGRAIRAGARFSDATHIVRVTATKSSVELLPHGAGRRPIFARVAVIATGANTALLSAIGIPLSRRAHTVAARVYMEGLSLDEEGIEFHFDGVPLPGYGWVFPTGLGTANVGAGTLGDSSAFRRLGRDPRRLLESFLGLPHVQSQMHGARRLGPVHSYPLRLDFPRARTHARRVLLVGEACGLVNPLTGEGIDYALESGQVAAEFLAESLAERPAAIPNGREYDARLRRRFQRLFLYTGRMRALYLQPWFLNRFMRLAASRPDLKLMLVDIALGMRDAAHGTTARTLLRVLRGA